MEKVNEESNMSNFALIPATFRDTLIYKNTPKILPKLLKKNTNKNEEEEEMFILPCFLHINTSCRTILKTAYINKFIDDVKDTFNHLLTMGLDGYRFKRNIKRKMPIFIEYANKHNDYFLQNLDCFQATLSDIYVTSNPYKHKTIEAPQIKDQFHSLCPVVTKCLEINESGQDSYKMITNIVAIQEAIVIYSRHCMSIYCGRINGGGYNIRCPTSATDFTKISKDMVLACLPFQRRILIISPSMLITKTLELGFFMVTYLGHCSCIGVQMFSKNIYTFDWNDNRITKIFVAKAEPTDIAVGPHNRILISFGDINNLICYNLHGQQMFVVETNCFDLQTDICVYESHFYVLQGHMIYKISARGHVTKRDIGKEYRNVCVTKDTIILIDYCGVPRIIRKNKYFWPRLCYSDQSPTPNFNKYFYIKNGPNVTNILPLSTSFILITYRNNKAILFTDTGNIISENYLTFPSFPSIICRLNSNTFLVFYRETKELQYITCPELTKGPLIEIPNDYIDICHIVSNRWLALTTSGDKAEVHVLLVNDDRVDIRKIVSLGHAQVTIAATPIHFVVVDRKKDKVVFYSTWGEELFEKYFQFYVYPHHIYSDNLYYYVLLKEESIVICYDIYGEMKRQWKLPFTVPHHIALFQGTLYMLDIELNRVLRYKYDHRSSGCCLRMKNPYITNNLNLRIKEEEHDKLLIGEICHLPNGQLVVVSDINNDCLFYVSKEGDIVSTSSLPSTATDICRWDSHQIGVTLPLEKQLWIIGTLTNTVRSVSLSQPYVRVRKLGKGQMVCYCDKPSYLDILLIRNYNQDEPILRIKIPFIIKSLSIDNDTHKVLSVSRRKVFQYNTRIIGGGGHGGISVIEMVPSVLLSLVKRPICLYGGCIDKLFVYLIDESRMFAINDHNLVVRDHVTKMELKRDIDLVDVFSRHICVTEMLSSSLYLQDLTVSDKGRHISVPRALGDERPVGDIRGSIITEDNLIAGHDEKNRNIKIVTFDGQLLDSIKVCDDDDEIRMCRWKSNTLVITSRYNKYRLWTLKVEFPLSLVNYQTRYKYKCIASLSNNRLVCSGGVECKERGRLYFVDIDEVRFEANKIKEINIPETLRTRYEDGRYYIHDILAIQVTDNDEIIVRNRRFIIFFNSDGQYLRSVRHYMEEGEGGVYVDSMTIDDSYFYIEGPWDKYGFGPFEYNRIVCFTQNGGYKRIFLNERIYKDEVLFLNINCKGPRFVGSRWRGSDLYVEGLFNVNRERFPVCRLQTDECPVEVKDLDICDEGLTVVCEKANNGNVKLFDEEGNILCCRNIGTNVGGLCFTEESDIMVTVPKREEIFQLKRGKGLEKDKVWQSRVPYGVIWRQMGNIYCCLHINLSQCDKIKIEGDQLELLESVSLLNLHSALHFPSSITSQRNNEIFSDELINKLKYAGEGDGGRGKPGEIVGKGRLKVRCGNYIAESRSGIDEISVRKLPYRTAMVPLSIPTWDEPVNYNHNREGHRSKLINLDENVSVLMFRETVTLISTGTGDILQHKPLPQLPPQQPPRLDMCRWTDERFVVVFGKQLMFFNRDLCCLKTINTGKYYNTICKHNDNNKLVCGGDHYIGDRTEDETGYYYYYRCKYYVDVVDVDDDGGTCKYSGEVCCGEEEVRVEKGNVVDVVVVVDIAVTSGGDIVVVKWDQRSDGHYVVCWYREQLLVRSIKLPPHHCSSYVIHRPCLTKHGEYVYVTDPSNNIFRIPGHIEDQTSEDIQQYLLLRWDDNEVFQVLGFHVSDKYSFMVFGIIPGAKSFAFFFYDT